MTIFLKQSTASQEIVLGPFVDSTDGVTAETALTIANTDVKIWVSGATTLANKNSGGATHISGGIYSAVLDATDTATLGSLKIFVAVSGALACVLECVVLAANVYDSLIAASDQLDVQVAGINNDAITAASLATDAGTEIATAVLDTAAGVETGRTVRQSMRLMLSALCGKASGMATTTAVFRDTNDTKDRISATVDADGNRSAVTLDAS